MRKIFLILPIAAILGSCSPIIYTNQPTYADQGQSQPVTDQVFYDELSPYGNWIDYPDYGYVWQPNVGPDFRPYETNGNWVYSEDGWTWASNYDWGWAPFHYGRWFFDGNYRWLWQPGNEWAPAWVTWGQSGDYYGWAALPPNVGSGDVWRPGPRDWSFVPSGNITQVNVNNYVVHNNVTVINNVTVVNNYNDGGYNNNGGGHRGAVYNRGPRVAEVEARTHRSIQPVRIGIITKPGQSRSNGQLNIYRPVIKDNPNQGNNRPAPRQVIGYRDNGNNNPNPHSGRGQNQNNNPQQGQNPRSGYGQGNGQNQNNNPQQGQNPRTGYGQGRGQNRNNNPQQGQNPRPVGQGNGQPQSNPQQPQQQTPVFGGGHRQNPSNNPPAQQPQQQQQRPVVQPQPRPTFPQRQPQQQQEQPQQQQRPVTQPRPQPAQQQRPAVQPRQPQKVEQKKPEPVQKQEVHRPNIQ